LKKYYCKEEEEKNPARIDPTPSHVMYLFTQDLCLHFISLPAVDDERKKVFGEEDFARWQRSSGAGTKKLWH